MNDRLADRRALLERRLLSAKIHILITLILTLLNTLAGLFTNWFFMFVSYGFFIPQYAIMAGRAFGITEEAIRPGTLILAGAVFLGVLIFWLLAFLNIKKKRIFADISFFLFIADCAALAVAALGITFSTIVTILYIANAFLHVYGAFILGRARRASHGLEVLPESEIEETGEDLYKGLRPEDETDDNGNKE